MIHLAASLRSTTTTRTLGALAVAGFAAVRTWNDKRRAASAAYDLNDRTLSDVGLSRSALFQNEAGLAFG